MKNIAIIGCSGSIGRQAADVCRRYPDRFRVVALAANTDAVRLAEQAALLRPSLAVLRQEGASADLPQGIRFACGESAFEEACAYPEADVVLVAVSGFAGLKNYRLILKDTGFLRTLLNTLLYVFWSLIIGYWVPFVLAVMLNEVLRGKSFFRFAMYLPSMAPGIAISMLWYYMYYPNGSGLLNMLLGWFGIEPQVWLQNANMTIPLIVITMSWSSFGSTMILYMADLQSVNNEV